MEVLDPADADIAERVAVVGAAKSEILGLLRSRIRPLPPELKGDLQRDLDRRRAIVGEEDVIESQRGQLDELAGEFDRRHVGHAEQRAVGDLVELRADGLVEFRDAVAVNVAPQRRDAVDVPVAVEILEPAALGALDDQRGLGGVGRHRRERVPDVLPIPLLQLLARRFHRVSCSRLPLLAHLRPSLRHQRSSLAPVTYREPLSAVAAMSGRLSPLRSATITWLAAYHFSLMTCIVHLPRGSPGFSNQTTRSPFAQAVATTSIFPSPFMSAANASK